MVRVTTFNASAQAPRRPYTNGVPWKQGDPKPAGLPMPEDLRARVEHCKTRNQKKGLLEFPKITFNNCVPTFPFLNGAYQVHWACTPGLVPGERKEKAIKDWNSNRQTVKDRGDRIHEMTETLARESGFKHAIIK